MTNASPADTAARYIADLADFQRLLHDLRARLATDPRLAVDTEFIRERTYRPLLEIVQVATSDGLIALLDIPALGGIGGLAPLLLDPQILKIVHAGGHDVEILAERLDGRIPTPIFDTQIAAAFTGGGLQTGYGALVQATLGVRLDKEEGFADWSRRPLTPSMRAYAANDVRYLHPLHDRLKERLERRGRVAWAQEQTDRTLNAAAATVAPEDLWRKVGGKQGLDGVGLAVLRELALWRDEEAQRRDRPRRSVLKDDSLVEISRRKPRSATAMQELRSLPGLNERVARDLTVRVEQGLSTPRDQWPRIEASATLDDHGAALLELLSAVVRVRAMEEDLPPSLLASADDLRDLAIHRRRPAADGPLFTGWRGTLVGTDLKAALDGTLAVAWEPKKGRLSLRREAVILPTAK